MARWCNAEAQGRDLRGVGGAAVGGVSWEGDVGRVDDLRVAERQVHDRGCAQNADCGSSSRSYCFDGGISDCMRENRQRYDSEDAAGGTAEEGGGVASAMASSAAAGSAADAPGALGSEMDGVSTGSVLEGLACTTCAGVTCGLDVGGGPVCSTGAAVGVDVGDDANGEGAVSAAGACAGDGACAGARGRTCAEANVSVGAAGSGVAADARVCTGTGLGTGVDVGSSCAVVMGSGEVVGRIGRNKEGLRGVFDIGSGRCGGSDRFLSSGSNGGAARSTGGAKEGDKLGA